MKDKEDGEEDSDYTKYIEKEEKSANEKASEILKDGKNIEGKLKKIHKEIGPTKINELQRRMISVYGKVQLDGDELAFLELGPDFALHEDIYLKK